MYAAVIDKYNQVVSNAEGDVIYTTARALSTDDEHSYSPLLQDLSHNSWNNGVIKIENLNLIGEPGS